MWSCKNYLHGMELQKRNGTPVSCFHAVKSQVFSFILRSVHLMQESRERVVKVVCGP